jgi:hypothetical protein
MCANFGEKTLWVNVRIQGLAINITFLVFIENPKSG